MSYLEVEKHERSNLKVPARFNCPQYILVPVETPRNFFLGIPIFVLCCIAHVLEHELLRREQSWGAQIELSRVFQQEPVYTK